ncbi:hypothetical protein [Mycobacterium hubeiense]|uniref:hypothetical protein n=1 Tax=Mycobacterium hubeiense TaxID=1867256 RepID=UPI000C7F0082|nr:hypothetical protein [Mycobacterium sp. QGD 101]
MRRFVRAAVFALAAVGWTIAAAYLVVIGRFAAADTRCGHVEPRVDMEGGWLVIAAAAVWAAPFVVVALWRRRRWQIAVAVPAVVVALGVVAEMFARPVAFCF